MTTNLEWLWEHEREKIIRNITMEDDPCDICPLDDQTCDENCTEFVREWLLSEHEEEPWHAKGGVMQLTRENVDKLREAVGKQADGHHTSEEILDRTPEWMGEFLNESVCENLHDSSEVTQKPRSKEADSGNVSDSDGENLHVEQDTREKLEEEANGYVVSWWHSDWVDTFEHANTMKRDVMHLLDRQAEITYDETMRTTTLAIREARKVQEERIAELRAERDEWRAKFTAAIGAIEEPSGWRDENRELYLKVDELQAKVDEYEQAAQGEFVVPLEDAMKFTTDPPGYVKAYIAELQARVTELERENARLSSDEFYLRCTLVDINGEVI